MSMHPPKKKLPVLRVHIPSPCEMDWAAMRGDGARRHCAHCDHDVHDLSALSREEVQALFEGSRGKLCVRGNFTDTGVLVSHADLARGRARAAARAALLAAAALGASACAEEPSVPIQVTGLVMQPALEPEVKAGADPSVNAQGSAHEVNAQAVDAGAQGDLGDAGCETGSLEQDATKGKRKSRRPVIRATTGSSGRTVNCPTPEGGEDPLCGL